MPGLLLAEAAGRLFGGVWAGMPLADGAAAGAPLLLLPDSAASAMLAYWLF